MHIIGYTYEADFHCVKHTEDRFAIEDGHTPTEYVDKEGNEVRAVLDIDEWLEMNEEGEEVPAIPHCSECSGMKFKIGSTVKVTTIVTDDSDADWYWRAGHTGEIVDYDEIDEMYIVLFGDHYKSAFYEEELELL